VEVRGWTVPFLKKMLNSLWERDAQAHGLILGKEILPKNERQNPMMVTGRM
jgi:hypothetical protein